MDAVHASDPGREPAGSLDALVVEVLARIDDRGTGAIEEACLEYPQHAEALRRRIASLRDLGLLAPTSSSGPPKRLGDFDLLETIGVGGMGVVYHALQRSLGRDVALKIIRPELLYLPGTRERFARETTIIARLQHPGIVPIYTVGAPDEVPYYAMERVPGCTLAEALVEIGRTPVDRLTGADLARAVQTRSKTKAEPGETGSATSSSLFDSTWEQTCLRIMRQVAEALEHAHGRGVLHRDLKPSNIMLTPGGRVMLVDFGLSHSEHGADVTQSGERIGSIPYMSPELLKGGVRAFDRRSDLYGLGVTLYQMLTLRLPFEAESVPAQIAAILEGRPPRPRTFAPGLSWEAETVTLAAIERDPARRYATVADFARDLDNALAHRPIEARRASAGLRTRRWIEHHPGAAAALLLAALVPTIAAAYQMRETARARESLQELTKQQALTQVNFERAMRAIDSMLNRVGSESLDNVPGLDAVRADLLGEATALYADAERERPSDHGIYLLGARSALLRAATLRRIGRTEEAETIVRDVIARLPATLPSSDYTLRHIVARSCALLGHLTKDPRESAEQLRLGLAAYTQLNADQPHNAEVRQDLIDMQVDALVALRAEGRRTELPVDVDAVEALARDALAEAPSADTRRGLARLLLLRGYWAGQDGNSEKALPAFEESLALRRSALAENPLDDDTRAEVAESASNLGLMHYAQGRAEKSLEFFDLALVEGKRNVTEYPDVVRYRVKLADTELNRGVALGTLGRKQEEQESLERAAALQAEIVAREPLDARQHQTLGTILLNLTGRATADKEPEKALELCDRARASFERAIELAPKDADIAAWLASERNARAGALIALGRIAEAAEGLADAPQLAMHRADRAAHGLKRSVVCLERARAGDDPETLERVERAARRTNELATARGDLERDPTLAKLRELLRER
jgi:serine/threonine protein kinase